MLFDLNNRKPFNTELFKNPTKEYRATPFWGWNGDLKTDELKRQIQIFKEMGMGGFHMHARAGLENEYLSDEFMQRVLECCEEADKQDMLAWLYDEDRYPSGPAGGIVTRNQNYTRRYLRITPNSCDSSNELARYAIMLNENNRMIGYKRLLNGEIGEGKLWYAYFEVQPASTDMSQTYVDALNPEAIEEFARVTYDRYKTVVGKYFGNVSPAIFTDEPQYMTETVLNFAGMEQDVILPWTNDLSSTFKAQYGFDILDKLPEIIWNLPDKLSEARYLYHDHVAERFVSAFCDTLGKWCENNGIMFTGHVMSEGSLAGQTIRSGEAMRCYRSFHIPGIDVLGTHTLEYTTAKQAQSAANQQGSIGLMSELYGVSGWTFDFRSFKLQGDWQAAMGVTVRVPHHSWYTMHSMAKRDYPGSIGYQSPWWKEYHIIEDHFARLNTALSRGKSAARIGIIHPIESLWLHFGPNDQSGAMVNQIENNFSDTINILTEGLIDFDFISEARLPELCVEGTSPLKVGVMEYDTVIVPALVTIRKSTLLRLNKFREAGGRVIFIGECPQYVDGKQSREVETLYGMSEVTSFDMVLEKLEQERFINVFLPDGNRASHLIYNLRNDGNDKWLFIATTRSQFSPDVDIPNQKIKFNVGKKFEAETLVFSINGEYEVTVHDTLTGDIAPLAVSYKDGKTVFRRKWYMHDSILLKLNPGKSCTYKEDTKEHYEELPRIFRKVPITLDEPNVLLLDMAEFSLDGGEMRPVEEILRLDNILRAECGIPMRKQQPYKIKEIKPTHEITLRFKIESEIEVYSCKLALEDRETAKIVLNGKLIEAEASGYYADRSIQTVELPVINKGENILELTVPLGNKTSLEYAYLLGDFGVSVYGIEKKITAPVRELAFGNIVNQGLPFYSGNVTYHLTVKTEGGIRLRVPHYRGALCRITVNGEDKGPLIFSPYSIDLPDLCKGEQKIDIKLYGTRQNTFGPLHHLGTIPFSQGPDSWRSTEDLWNYEYCFSEMGVMSSPRFYRL